LPCRRPRSRWPSSRRTAVGLPVPLTVTPASSPQPTQHTRRHVGHPPRPARLAGHPLPNIRLDVPLTYTQNIYRIGQGGLEVKNLAVAMVTAVRSAAPPRRHLGLLAPRTRMDPRCRTFRMVSASWRQSASGPLAKCSYE
jgi:hypothetical protein